MYDLPLRTTIVFFLTLSRTLTLPCVTRVSVSAHESWTSHFVPRTVAALYLPLVRNLPLPSPQSLRVLGFLAAARAFRASGRRELLGQRQRVIPPDWETLKMPS